MNKLRPTRFKDLMGQKDLLESLKISVLSANKRNDSLNHCLFYGQAGLGKTTIAEALANELGVKIQVANGANLRSIKNLIPYIMRAEERSVLFIDEIHRMTTLVEEFLYPIMEDFKLDMSVNTGKNEEGKVISMPLPKFTIVGATTEAGTLPAPLRDRFKLKFNLKLYKGEVIQSIIKGNAKKLNINITEEASKKLSGACRGTPRIANGLLEWVRDYAIAKSLPAVTGDDLMDCLRMKKIGLDGSTEVDRKYLNFLKKQDKPVGVSTISASTNIDRDTIENVVEPFLLYTQKILKTPKGRVAL